MGRKPWILLLALFLTACGRTAASLTPAADTATGNTTQAARAASIAAVLPADIKITAYQGVDVLGGQEVQLSDLLAQGKPVVLNFWAGLCPPCRLEMPDLQAAYEQFGDRVILLGLDVGPFTALGSNEQGRALIKELGVTYPAGTTSDPTVVRSYQLTGMPSTYFIEPSGEIVRKWTGLLTQDKLAELIAELLAASS